MSQIETAKTANKRFKIRADIQQYSARAEEKDDKRDKEGL